MKSHTHIILALICLFGSVAPITRAEVRDLLRSNDLNPRLDETVLKLVQDPRMTWDVVRSFNAREREILLTKLSTEYGMFKVNGVLHYLLHEQLGWPRAAADQATHAVNHVGAKVLSAVARPLRRAVISYAPPGDAAWAVDSVAQAQREADRAATPKTDVELKRRGALDTRLSYLDRGLLRAVDAIVAGKHAATPAARWLDSKFRSSAIGLSRGIDRWQDWLYGRAPRKAEK